MSIALSLEMQEAVERCATKRGIKISSLFQDLIKKYVIPNPEFYTIILKIPKDLKNKPVELKDWLDARSAVVIKSLNEPDAAPEPVEPQQ